MPKFPFTPDRYKQPSDLLPDEPTFTIRAKDNKSVDTLKLLQPIYNIDPRVIEWFEEWRANHPENCKDPDFDNKLLDR